MCHSEPSRRPTSTPTQTTSSPLRSAEEDSDINEALQHLHKQWEGSNINEFLQLPHQQPHPEPQLSPMASPKNVLPEPSLASIRSLMRGLAWKQEYGISRGQGDAAPQ